MNREWVRFTGYECPVEDDDVLLDIMFENGHVMTGYFPWEIKWSGDNPGYGYVDKFRVSEKSSKQGYAA